MNTVISSKEFIPFSIPIPDYGPKVCFYDVQWTPTLYIQNKRNKRRNWMQDAYDKTLLNTSLFSYNKQVLIREKELYVSALRNVWKTNAC